MSLFPDDGHEDDHTFVSTHDEPALLEEEEEPSSPFFDEDFPPTYESLVGGRSEADIAKHFSDFANFSWLRMIDLADQKPQVFIDGVCIHDIMQGGLGDCYFLGAVSALAEFPGRVERLFLTKEFSPVGKYRIALCFSGVWLRITVDDHLPVTPQKKLAFARSLNFELWVSLLEKAYAKCFGAYAHIGSCGASVFKALQDITGAPTFNFNHETYKGKEAELLAALKEADRLNHIMVCSTVADTLTNGLVSNHAYTLISLLTVNGTTLLKLRNPWGRGEWTGDWSDKSSLWTEAQKQTVYFSNKDDGLFYMSFEDFMRYFNWTTICHYSENKVGSCISSTVSDESDLFLEFAVESPGDYYFCVQQVDKRCFFGQDYKYGVISFVVARSDAAGNWFFVASSMTNKRSTWVKVDNCQPGSYLVLLFANWDCGASEELNFSVYGPQEVHFASVRLESSRQKAYEYIAKALAHKMLHLDGGQLKDCGTLCKYGFLENTSNYLLMVIQNTSDKVLRVNISKLQNNVYLHPQPVDPQGQELALQELPIGSVNYYLHRFPSYGQPDGTCFTWAK